MQQELAVTMQCPIIGVKKNPNNPMYTQLGVLTRAVTAQATTVTDLLDYHRSGCQFLGISDRRWEGRVGQICSDHK